MWEVTVIPVSVTAGHKMEIAHMIVLGRRPGAYSSCLKTREAGFNHLLWKERNVIQRTESALCINSNRKSVEVTWFISRREEEKLKEKSLDFQLLSKSWLLLIFYLKKAGNLDLDGRLLQIVRTPKVLTITFFFPVILTLESKSP